MVSGRLIRGSQDWMVKGDQKVTAVFLDSFRGVGATVVGPKDLPGHPGASTRMQNLKHLMAPAPRPTRGGAQL